jgi:hypothetical protein
LSPDDHAQIFVGMKEIAAFQVGFMNQVDEAVYKDPSMQGFGGIFAKAASDVVNVYSNYGAQQTRAIRTLYKYQNNEKFADLVKRAYVSKSAFMAGLSFASPPIINLMTWLIKPLQRLSSYQGLITSLKDVTSPEFKDYQELGDAELLFAEAIRKISEAKRLAENREILSDLSSRIDEWDVSFTVFMKLIILGTSIGTFWGFDYGWHAQDYPQR